MSSSTFAYSDSSIPSDDSVTLPRLHASGVASCDSDVVALKEDVNDCLTVGKAEATAAAKGDRAATLQHIGHTVAPYSKKADIAETRRRLKRALYRVGCHDENQAAPVSTVPRTRYRKLLPRTSKEQSKAVGKRKSLEVGPRGLNKTPAGVANVTSVHEGDEDNSRLLGNDFGSPSSRNRFIDGFMRIYQSSQGIELNHIQTRLAECQKTLNVNVTPSMAADKPPLAPVVATRPVDQMQPDGTAAQVATYCDLCPPSSYSQPVVADNRPPPPVMGMRPVDQMRQPDGTAASAAMHCDLCAQSSYSQPIAADRPPPPPAVATRPVNQMQPDGIADQVPVYCPLCPQSSYSQPVTADKPPLPPVIATRPINQMQPDPTATQVATYCNLCPPSSYSHVHRPEHTKYGNSLPAYNGFRPGFGPSSGMNVMNPSNLASSGYVPGFNPSYQYQYQQWHAPAASNYNRASSDNQSYIQGQSSNATLHKHFVSPTQAYTYRYIYGPPAQSYVVTPFIQGSSRDGIQPSTYPLTSTRPPASPPPSSSGDHKRPHGLGWETGRSPNRRRVVSSPGYIESSAHSSDVPEPPSSPPSSPALSDTEAPVPADNDDVIEMFFTRRPETHSTDWYCTYKCPKRGGICGKLLRDVKGSTRNRFRHLATHAHREEKCVARGLFKVENTLLLTRLKKVVADCSVPGCRFRKEVWRTDNVREEHEKEVHPELYERRKQRKKKEKEMRKRMRGVRK